MTSERSENRSRAALLPLNGEGRPPSSRGLNVCVVGPGTRFLSGISYYTSRLSTTLAAHHSVSVILMRQLLPTRLYPGAMRVGTDLARLGYSGAQRVYDGIDWWWGRSLLAALRLLRRSPPDVVVLQWWTGTVLHSYLALALAARALGARVVVEFHELLDTGELNLAVARWYVRCLAPVLLALSDGFVVHNEFDRASLVEAYGIDRKPVEVVPHGPYDQYAVGAPSTGRRDGGLGRRDGSLAGSEVDACRLLYFGVIRPFKGVEDVIRALDSMTEHEVRPYHLTVVGETWENWTLPAECIARSPHRDRITFINRYVTDAEVAGLFADADVVVLPYHRSSSSGPLHIAMSYGIPVIVSAVGGLIEATAGYAGALRIPPRDPAAIRNAIHQAAKMRGQRFPDVHSWQRTSEGYWRMFERVGPTTWSAGDWRDS